MSLAKALSHTADHTKGVFFFGRSAVTRESVQRRMALVVALAINRHAPEAKAEPRSQAGP